MCVYVCVCVWCELNPPFVSAKREISNYIFHPPPDTISTSQCLRINTFRLVSLIITILTQEPFIECENTFCSNFCKWLSYMPDLNIVFNDIFEECTIIYASVIQEEQLTATGEL